MDTRSPIPMRPPLNKRDRGALSPAAMEVKAIVEKKLPAPYDKQQKDVYMLRVRFTLKRPATKGRRRFF